MNKKMLLVFTCTLFMAFAGLQVFAQSSSDPAASQQPAQPQAAPGADPDTQSRVDANLQNLSSQLNLTDDQKAQLKPIVQQEIQQLRAVNDDASLNEDQKKAKYTEIRQAARNQMDPILNAEQKKKLKLLKETSPN